MDFRELADAFLDYLRGLTLKTVRAYRIALHQFESYWANLDSADKERAAHRAVSGSPRIAVRSLNLAESAIGERRGWEKRYAPPPDTKDIGYVHENLLC